MTNITELAQSHELLIANGQQTADLLRHLADNEIDSDYFAVVSECESYGKETDAELSITEFALRAAGYVDALVEALEKAQQERDNWCTTFDNERFRADKLKAYIDAMEPIRAAAEKLVRCKGRYHSEQNYRALAALFGVNTPDLPPLEHENVHYADAAEMEIAALRQRIAELEESHAQVIQSRDHYKRMLEEGLEQLAESRTVTVKLPDLRQIVSGDRYVWSDGVYNYSQDVKAILADAGIKVEAE
ncbi:TPA: ead/Ea22-like family protein [Klebsiella pneumoniae]|nr:ead/Ea22-like family protein [Klebsiella pneumoniae]